MNTIEQIESQGITVSLFGDKIKLTPVEKVTPAVVADAKAHKPQIIDTLRAKERLRIPCYCCGSQNFWRKKDNIGGRWICSECHPPMPPKDQIEWLQ